MTRTPPPDRHTLEKYQLGLLTPEEVETVEHWVKVDPTAADTLAGIHAADPVTRAAAGPAPDIGCPESAVDAAIRVLADHLPQIPARVGNYRVVGQLGCGGMGVVLEGADERIGRAVAIKLIAAQYATDPAVRERFRREAEAVGRIDHGNVVPVYEFGEEDA